MNDSTLPTSPAWPTRWPQDSFKSAWTWVLAALLAAFAILAFYAGVKGGNASVRSVDPMTLDKVFAVQFAAEAALIAIVLIALPRLSKFRLRELGFELPNAATIGTALVGALAMAVVADGGASLIGYLEHSAHQQDIVEVFRGLRDPATITIFAVFAILFAPFVEETIFRIFFFNLGMRYGGFWIGAILSGGLFGLAHGDPFAALPLALGGVILCYVYYRTRNAYAPMITHALFNTLTLAALFFAPGIASN